LTVSPTLRCQLDSVPSVISRPHWGILMGVILLIVVPQEWASTARTAFSTSAASGRYRRSSSGAKGTGVCGGVTGSTGARREENAFSDRKSTRLNSSHVKISYAV